MARSGFEKGLEEVDRIAPGMSAETMWEAFSAAVAKHDSGGFIGIGYYGAEYELGKAAAYADSLGLYPTAAIRAEQVRLTSEGSK